jgi:GNAT superfamily N-acetyltransferase
MPGLPLRTGVESGAGPSEGSEAVRVTQMHEPLISGGTVRKLWVDESELYRQHLLRLDAESRRNRFGGAVSDEYIERYAEPSALRDAVIYGFFVDGVLRGAAELRLLARAGEAEAALSVEPVWQSRGVGTALLERVLLAAGNREVKHLHILCLAENRPMQKLARKFDAELSFQSGNVVGDVKAPRPTPMSMVREIVDDSINLATAMLDVPAQLAKRLEHLNGSPERRGQDRGYVYPAR